MEEMLILEWVTYAKTLTCSRCHLPRKYKLTMFFENFITISVRETTGFIINLRALLRYVDPLTKILRITSVYNELSSSDYVSALNIVPLVLFLLNVIWF